MAIMTDEFRSPARIASDEAVAHAVENDMPLPGDWLDVLPEDCVHVSLSPLPLPGKRNLFREKIQHDGTTYTVRNISFTDAAVTVELEPTNAALATTLAQEIGGFAETTIAASHLSRIRSNGERSTVQEKA